MNDELIKTKIAVNIGLLKER